MRILLILLSLGYAAHPAFCQSVKNEQNSGMRSAAELRDIINDADEQWNVPDELQIYPRIESCSALLDVTQNKESSNKAIVVSNRSSRGKYIVHSRIVPGLMNESVFDVVAYDAASDVYRRWRIDFNDKISVWTGVGNQPNGKSRPEDSDGWYTISWTKSGTRNLAIASEQLSSATALAKHRWRSVELSNGVKTFEESYSATELVNRADIPNLELAARQQPPSSFMKADNEDSMPAADNKSSSRSPFGEFLSRLTGDSARENSNTTAPPYRLEQFNFEIKNPGSQFVKLDPAVISPAACLVLRRSDPFQFFFAITEKQNAESPISMDYLMEFVQSGVASSAPGTTFGKTSRTNFGGVEFVQFESTSKGPSPITRWHSLAIHRGFVYQFLMAARNHSVAATKRASDSIMGGFRLIDANRKSDTDAPDFSVPSLGLAASFQKLNGLVWSTQQMNVEYPGAEYGTRFDDGGYVLIIPVDLNSLEVDDNDLNKAMLAAAGLAYPDDFQSDQPINQGNGSGRRLIAATNESGLGKVTTEARVIRNGESAVALIATGVGSDAKLRKTLSDRLDAVIISEPPPTNSGRLITDKTRRDDNVLNDIGIIAYGEGNYELAHQLFAKAFQIQPDLEQFLLNDIDALFALEKNSEALEQITHNKARYAASLELKAREAILLVATEQPEAAVKQFSQLFDAGYDDEDVLLDYLNTLTELGRSDDSVAACERFIAKQEGVSIRVRRWHRDLLSQADQLEKAVAVAKNLAEEFPDVQQLTEDYVQCLIDVERSEDALQLLATIKAKKQASAQTYYLEGQALLDQEKYSNAKAAFESALALAPGDPTALEMISLTSALLGEGDNSSIKDPLQAVAIPKELQILLSNARRTNVEAGFSKHTVESATGHYIQKGEPRRRTEYRYIQIMNQAGVEEMKTLRCRFDPTFERAFINSLQVLDESGAVVAKGNVNTYYLNSDTSSGMATTESTLCVPVPGLKPGYFVRYVYTIEDKSSSDVIDFEERFFVSAAPDGPQAVFVSGDIDNLKTFHTNGDFKEGRNETSAWWILKSVPRFHYEPLLPAFENFVPHIWFSNSQTSWTDIGNEYLTRLAAPVTPDLAAATLAREVVGNARTSAEKTKKILEWLRTGLVYQAIEFGTRAQIPNKAETIIQNRYGDCKDHSLLALQMLRSVGIPCELAVVNTDAAIQKEFPSLAQFNHMIVYLPTADGGRFVDCTAKNHDVSLTASSWLSDQEALILAADEIKFAKIEPRDELANRLISKRVVSVAPEQRAFFVQEELTIWGNSASSFRAYFQSINVADRKDRLQDLLGTNSRIAIRSLQVDNVEDFDKPIKLTMTYDWARAVRGSQNTLAGNLPAVWENYFFEQPATSERKHPFRISETIELQSNVRIVAPVGFVLNTTGLSEAEINTAWFSCQTKLREINDGFEYELATAQHAGVFPRADWQSYLDSLNDALEVIQGRVVFNKSE